MPLGSAAELESLVKNVHSYLFHPSNREVYRGVNCLLDFGHSMSGQLKRFIHWHALDWAFQRAISLLEAAIARDFTRPLSKKHIKSISIWIETETKNSCVQNQKSKIISQVSTQHMWPSKKWLWPHWRFISLGFRNVNHFVIYSVNSASKSPCHRIEKWLTFSSFEPRNSWTFWYLILISRDFMTW